MVEYIKGLFTFWKKNEDNITEIHLNHNEPKYYYNNELKKWVIEEENEKEIIQKDKFPPNAKIINNNNSSEEHNNKKISTPCGPSSRYKNFLNSESIILNNNTELQYKNQIDKLKSQNKKEMKELNEKINELNGIIRFNEENYEKSVNLLKQKLENFMSENLSLKQKIEELNDVINVKDKTIQENKDLINKYQEIITSSSNQEINKDIIYENNNNIDQGNLLLLNSQLEQLKSEKVFLENDKNKLQNINENYQRTITELKHQIEFIKTEIKKNDEYQKSTASTVKNENINHHNKSTNNKNLLLNINKLNSENFYLRSQIEKLKCKNYELQSKNCSDYNEESIELTKIKNELFKTQSKVLSLTNEEFMVRDFIQKETKNYIGIFKNNLNEFSSNEYSTTNLCILIKKMLNQIIVLNSVVNITKDKDKYYEEEIKNLQIENEILKDTLNDKENDYYCSKETIDEYETLIQSLKENCTKYKRKCDEAIKEYKKNKKELDNYIETNKMLQNEKETLHNINDQLIYEYNNYKVLLLSQIQIDTLNKIQIELYPINCITVLGDNHKKQQSNGLLGKIISPFFKRK